MADDDDEEMRKLEALLDKLFSKTVNQVQNLVAAIPEVISHSLSDAAFEQSEYIGASFCDQIVKGLKPIEKILDQYTEIFETFSLHQQQAAEHQLKLIKELHRLWLANVILVACLMASIGFFFFQHAFVETHPRAEYPRVILPQPLLPPASD